MRQIINCCFALLLFAYAGCDTAGNVDPVFKQTFIRYYGTEGDQYASDLMVNEDGTMVMLANSVSLTGERRAFVIKVDAEGNAIWKTDVGTINAVGVDLEPVFGTTDFVVALNNDNGISSRIQLVKVSQTGTADDPKEIPLHPNGGYRQVARSITSFESGEFVITGRADRGLITETEPVNESNDQSDILAFRLDNALNFVENIVTKGGEQDGCGIRAFQIEEDRINAGKIVLFSYTDRPFLTDGFGYNFSFDVLNSGTPVGKLIGLESEQELLSTVVKVPFLHGGGYLMAGTAKPTMNAPGELYLVKYDDDFQQKALDVRLSLAGNLECISADDGPSGYYLLANEQNEGASRDITLVSVDRDGNEIWTRKFGTREGDDASASVVSLPDGRIAVAATIELETKRKVALIVVKSNGDF
jgi:hypothetical protein